MRPTSFQWQAVLAMWLMALSIHPAAVLAQTITSEVSVTDELQIARPDYQRPADKDLLFYVQRSTNPNTVVYAARRDAQGGLDTQLPVDVYWRRFASDGNRSELTYLERTLAYGIDVRPLGTGEGAFAISLVSYPKRKVVLTIDSDGSPFVLMETSKHRLRLKYAYIQVADDGLMPSIDYIHIFGQDIESGRYVREQIRVTQQSRSRPDGK